MYKVYVLFQNVRSVHSVCSGGLGFVVSDTGQCDNCEGGAARKALHQKSRAVKITLGQEVCCELL